MPLPTPSRLVPLCSAESLKLARSFTDTPRRWLMSLRLSAASMLDLAKAAKPAADNPAPMPMVPISPRSLAAPASSPRMLRAAESNAPLVSSFARIRICAKSATGQLLFDGAGERRQAGANGRFQFQPLLQGDALHQHRDRDVGSAGDRFAALALGFDDAEVARGALESA